MAAAKTNQAMTPERKSGHGGHQSKRGAARAQILTAPTSGKRVDADATVIGAAAEGRRKSPTRSEVKPSLSNRPVTLSLRKCSDDSRDLHTEVPPSARSARPWHT